MSARLATAKTTPETLAETAESAAVPAADAMVAALADAVLLVDGDEQRQQGCGEERTA